MTPAEPDNANLIALTHAQTALRAATHYTDPRAAGATPPRATQQHPIAAVSHLSPRWPRAGAVAECAPQIFTDSCTGGDASGVSDACAGYVL
jgi:hypothetical protein